MANRLNAGQAAKAEGEGDELPAFASTATNVASHPRSENLDESASNGRQEERQGFSDDEGSLSFRDNRPTSPPLDSRMLLAPAPPRSPGPLEMGLLEGELGGPLFRTEATRGDGVRSATSADDHDLLSQYMQSAASVASDEDGNSNNGSGGNSGRESESASAASGFYTEEDDGSFSDNTGSFRRTAAAAIEGGGGDLLKDGYVDYDESSPSGSSRSFSSSERGLSQSSSHLYADELADELGSIGAVQEYYEKGGGHVARGVSADYGLLEVKKEALLGEFEDSESEGSDSAENSLTDNDGDGSSRRRSRSSSWVGSSFGDGGASVLTTSSRGVGSTRSTGSNRSAGSRVNRSARSGGGGSTRSAGSGSNRSRETERSNRSNRSLGTDRSNRSMGTSRSNRSNRSMNTSRSERSAGASARSNRSNRSESRSRRDDLSASGSSRQSNRRRRPRATTPGVVQVRGRARGHPSAIENERESAVPHDIYGGNSMTSLGSAHSAALSMDHVVEASLIQDEEEAGVPVGLGESFIRSGSSGDVVYAEAERMPSGVKLLLKERPVQCCICAGLLTIVGLAVLVAGVAFSAFDSGDAASSQAGATPAEVAYNLPTVSPMPSQSPTFQPSAFPTVNLDDIQNALSKFSTSESLKTVGSPQHSAMFWLANYDRTGIEYSDRMFHQRYALLVLYFATNKEPGWISKDNWADPDKYECDWGRGITCETNVALQERTLTGLDLSKNGLRGSLPPEMGLLTKLEELFLNENSIGGFIPKEVGDMASLKRIEMERNEFIGIPEEIGKIIDLTWLDLSHNQINRTIPDNIYELTKLRSLDLSYNSINGKLSDGLKQLTVLTRLNLVSNSITGTIPVSFGDMPDLAFIYLDYNKITGTIPVHGGFVAKREEFTFSNNLMTGTIPTGIPPGSSVKPEEFRLQKVDLSHNKINGTIPYVLAFLPSLKYIDMSHNQLTGTIFSTLNYLPTLQFLSVSNNRLHGNIPIPFPDSLAHLELQNNNLTNGLPAELAAMPNLAFFDAENNPIGGELPSEIGNIYSLRYFNVRNCSIVGSIPTTFVKLKDLDFLNLGENYLTGPIPNMGSLDSLVNLNLDFNYLEGPIPSTLGGLTDIKLLALQNNSLTGQIPDELGNLEDLEALRLAGNNLSGTVPVGLCDLQRDRVDLLHLDCDVECTCCEHKHCGYFADEQHFHRRAST